MDKIKDAWDARCAAYGNLKAGDVVLFAGKCATISKVVKPVSVCCKNQIQKRGARAPVFDIHEQYTR